MSSDHFLLQHPIFWVVVYGLALSAWACIGRFLLAPLVSHHPGNVIWRTFRLMTGWAVAATRLITPAYIPDAAVPLAAAFWLFVLRHVIGLALIVAGLGPRVAAPAAG